MKDKKEQVKRIVGGYAELIERDIDHILTMGLDADKWVRNYNTHMNKLEFLSDLFLLGKSDIMPHECTTSRFAESIISLCESKGSLYCPSYMHSLRKNLNLEWF